MPVASCTACGWSQEYASKQSRWTGQRRHAARDCRPPVIGNPNAAEAGLRGAAATRRAAETRDRAALAAAGFKGERTAAEWVAHPTALDDLLRVMCGTKRYVIDAERQLARELGAA